MRFEFKEIIVVVVPYFGAVSACYLFGYWGALNVNILEYVDFVDIAKLSIYPLLASLAIFLLGSLISELLVSPHLPVGGGNDTAIGRFGLKHGRVWLALTVVAGAGVVLFGQEPWRWFFVPLVGATFSLPLQRSEWLIDKIPEPKVRTTLLSWALILPGLCFFFGRMDSHFVKTGQPTNIVDVGRSKLPLYDDPKHPVSLLGFVGGTYILFEAKSGQVIYVRQSDSTTLYVTPKVR